MLARSVRSGVVETYHDGAIMALAPDGTEQLAIGDVDRVFLLRSAIKPFQALISLEAGVDLDREQLALAAASHGGQPVHTTTVERILAGAGLTPNSLQCPPARPPSPSARDRHLLAGGRPAPIFHNCSGKHAAALAACVAQSWPTETYLEGDHPYQRRVMELVRAETGGDVTPAGVDGCGFPTLRGSVRGLARAFARLADDRYRRVTEAMAATPALVSDGQRADAAVATWLAGVAKDGAEASAGVYLPHRVALGAKCWDGSRPALWVGIIAALDRLGVLEPMTREVLAPHLSPVVTGGGRPVGALEPALA